MATSGSGTDGESYGGKQAISGAHVYLFAANTEGWGKPSISLLDPTLSGVSVDSTGAYVTSSSTGGFNFTGRYTCTPGQQVYVYAYSGNPGHPSGQFNPAIGMLAIFGTCPNSGTFAGTISSFQMNEVTTVAAAYALSGFMTDPSHVAAGPTTNAMTGLANAFANYNNLVDLGSGVAKANNDDGNGFIPQAKINAIANSLVPCVNSTATSTACNTLFASTRTSAGGTPSTAAAAVLAMAHNPAQNVAQIFGIAGALSPYQPTLSAAPVDWTLSLTFFYDNMPGPYYPAVDSQGNIWVPGYASSNIVRFSPLGNVNVDTFTSGGVKQPFAIAIDTQDNAWAVNYMPGATTISRIAATGSAAGSVIPCGSYCFFPAFDTAGNLWVSGTTQTTVFDAGGNKRSSFATDAYTSGIAVASSGTAWTLGHAGGMYKLTPPSATTRLTQSLTATDGNDLTPVAIDANENIWFVSGSKGVLGKADSNGAMISSSGYTGGGLNSPAGLAIDGSGRVWVANRGNSSISEFGSDGTALSPATGLGTDTYTVQDVEVGIHGPRGIVVDNAGNVWVTNFTYNSITELVGAATPTATPILPSNHGKLP
jgi:streptogramin lyase